MKKVVIIGAGPAGLTAGYELLKDKKNEYEVIILEAEKQVGGISKTIEYNENRMDIGGHRFFSKDERIMNFWKELMPIQGEGSKDDNILNREKKLEKCGPNPEVEDEVMLVRQRISRIYYLKKFFDYPVSMKFDTFKNMGLLRTIKAGFSYIKSLIFKRKENSLEDFYINRFGRVLYSMFFEKYTEKLWGRHPSQISPEWGAQRVKGLSIISVIKDSLKKLFGIKNKNIETSLIEEFWYPKYGPGQLWEVLEKRVENLGAKIQKGFEVKKVNLENNIIKSIQVIHDGVEYRLEADIFISSMPIKDLVNGMDNVPENINKIADGLPYRDFLTVGILAKKLNIENKTKIKTINNIVPDCWIYVQEPDIKMGRIQIFNNWSPYLVKDLENTVWIGLEYFCNEGDKYWNMNEQDFTKFAIDELVKMKIVNKEDILDSHEEKVKKAYPAYFDTYSKFNDLKKFLNKIENLYCIGRNGQHRYNNMDHSMLTAIETADNIKTNKNTKENIWNVNTERQYHEKKIN